MPITPSRVYSVIGKESLEDVHRSLNNGRLVDDRETEEETYHLQTIVEQLNWSNDHESLNGTMTYESLRTFRQIDGTTTSVTPGYRGDFTFFFEGIKLYLVVFSNMYIAENIAHRIDRFFNMNLANPHPQVFNNFISTEGIEQFLRDHPSTIKDCGWMDLNYVGVDKSRLGGGNVYQFPQSVDYDRHGRKKFVLLELNDNGWVIRISKDGMVTFYTTLPIDVILRFIREEIVTLPT